MIISGSISRISSTMIIIIVIIINSHENVVPTEIVWGQLAQCELSCHASAAARRDCGASSPRRSKS